MTRPEFEPSVEITAPAHGGYGVARLDGRVVFVRFAIPGELVKLRLDPNQGEDDRFWTAEVSEIITPSPQRVAHPWPAAGPGGSGGADLGHLSVSAGRTWKQQILTEQLRRLGQISEPQVQMVGDDADLSSGGLGYRTRIQLTAGPEGRLGMMAPQSHQHVALDSMPLAVTELQELIPWDRKWEPGTRVSAIAPSASPAVLLANGEVLQNSQTGRQGASIRERVEVAGNSFEFQLSASGFWQVHRSAPHLLLGELERALQRSYPQGIQGLKILELYSGAGLFTQFLAQRAGGQGKVWAVEGDRSAHRSATANSAHLPQVMTINADLRKGAPVTEPVDLMVLDPPRSGIAKRLLQSLAKLAPRAVILVSCDPAALGRDVYRLSQAGYELNSVVGLDIFPLTHHVEAVSVFTRAGS